MDGVWQTKKNPRAAFSREKKTVFKAFFLVEPAKTNNPQFCVEIFISPPIRPLGIILIFFTTNFGQKSIGSLKMYKCFPPPSPHCYLFPLLVIFESQIIWFLTFFLLKSSVRILSFNVLLEVAFTQIGSVIVLMTVVIGVMSQNHAVSILAC